MTPTHLHNIATPGGDNSFRRVLRLIALAAILLRIAILLFAEVRPAMFDFPDSHRYVRVARNIAAGRGPIDDASMRSGTDPLYPLMLSAAPLVGINNETGIMRFGRICNSALSVASILLLAGIGRRLFGDRVALVAAAILAVDPILNFFNALVLTESLYITLLLAAYYSILRISDIDADKTSHATRPAAWALLAGACAGLGTLSRSTNLFLPLLLAPFVPWAYSRVRTATGIGRFVRHGDTFLIAVLVMLAPTLIRNYGLYHEIVPTRVGGGASLLEALGTWADGAPGMDRIQYPPVHDALDEYQRDREYREIALSWATDHPKETLQLAFVKLMRTWSIEINAADYTSPLLRSICWLSVAPIFALAAVGVWMTRNRPAILALLLAPALYFTLIHMVFVGSVRYRLPAMPFLFVLAAVAIDALIDRRRGTVR
ncbi:MAG: glycosyltransferase family 39 protein [Planctomycetes bacterium]|nr:glycosyltransferase family 39 protein [Planctomycetota bacterium]